MAITKRNAIIKVGIVDVKINSGREIFGLVRISIKLKEFSISEIIFGRNENLPFIEREAIKKITIVEIPPIIERKISRPIKLRILERIFPLNKDPIPNERRYNPITIEE
jgi:hypothetical protein